MSNVCPKSENDVEDNWKTEADLGCETGWFWKTAATLASFWTVTSSQQFIQLHHNLESTKKELASGIKSSVHWVCIRCFLVIPCLKLCNWLMPWPENSFWAFPPQTSTCDPVSSVWSRYALCVRTCAKDFLSREAQLVCVWITALASSSLMQQEILGLARRLRSAVKN